MTSAAVVRRKTKRKCEESRNDWQRVSRVLEKEEVELVRQWAKRVGFPADQIPDLLQDVAMAVMGRLDEWPPAGSAERKHSLWLITRNTMSKIKRAERRRRHREEQKALMTEEAYCDNVTPLRLDVQEVVAGLDGRCQAVCKLLSEGLTIQQIAEQMQCGWHTVDRLVRTIRQRLEKAGVNEWLQ